MPVPFICFHLDVKFDTVASVLSVDPVDPNRFNQGRLYTITPKDQFAGLKSHG